MSARRPERIVVGVSGSLRNVAVVRTAAELASVTGRVLIAVTTWEPFGGDALARRCPSAELDAMYRDDARARLKEALDGLPDDVLVDSLVARGRPAPVLIDIVRPGDLLVVGAGRTRGLGSVLRGSVSRFCVRRARCPVVVVPEPALVRDLSGLVRTVQRAVTREPAS